jgi:uncharacterized protein
VLPLYEEDLRLTSAFFRSRLVVELMILKERHSEARLVEKLEQVPRLLRVLAHTSAQLTHFTQIGGQLGLDDKTTRTYRTDDHGARLPERA